MIVVRVELHSAVTGRVSELARMHICNEGGTPARRNYSGKTYVGRDAAALDRQQVSHTGEVLSWPSPKVHIWNLVHRMLQDMGYVK